MSRHTAGPFNQQESVRNTLTHLSSISLQGWNNELLHQASEADQAIATNRAIENLSEAFQRLQDRSNIQEEQIKSLQTSTKARQDDANTGSKALMERLAKVETSNGNLVLEVERLQTENENLRNQVHSLETTENSLR
ncbi:hypothetical protein BT63DRAFT_77433 [Microthyrium microscopicum]|uniref:Uncharacterized protein n=1 Tax=Microthyrium microscopicum TaxID=703497 RepID=A0A6A6U3Z7_9PEZI|nr:hypothetical protein BT63DRAFT_77433 [Microthyrium microscopicum]